jgi:hypothetical protein
LVTAIVPAEPAFVYLSRLKGPANLIAESTGVKDEATPISPFIRLKNEATPISRFDSVPFRRTSCFLDHEFGNPAPNDQD